VAAVSESDQHLLLSAFCRKTLTSHVRELFDATLNVTSVLSLHGILNGGWHRVINAQDLALNELDLPGRATLETAAAHATLTTLLSLTPSRIAHGALAASIRRGHAARHTESGAGILPKHATLVRLHIAFGQIIARLTRVFVASLVALVVEWDRLLVMEKAGLGFVVVFMKLFDSD